MKTSILSLGFRATVGISVIALTAGLASQAHAQVTTSSVRGQVLLNGTTPVSGAFAEIRHIPTGTVSTATSNSNGVFSARNLRVGGPYTVTVSGEGFQTKAITDIYIGVDEIFGLDVIVGEAAMDEVVATGTIAVQSYMDTGLSSTFNVEDLREIVSIDRDIADVAQLDPFATINRQGNGTKELSIAGANNRFNSLTIDGVALNDRFGLNANGYPTQRSPLPYDAIESISIETAPYDTEFNGFTGGTINAVTKSGENELHGSAAFYYTDDSLGGSKIRGEDRDVSFEEKSYAFTLGGPIVKDKLFFFGAYEKFEEAAALRDGPIGSGALNITDIEQSEIDAIRDTVSRVYGFDAGGFAVEPVTEEKYLASIDWNISNNHRAKFTYLHNTGAAINQQDGNSFLEDRGVDILGFSSTWYNNSEEVDTYIGHIFSDWTENLSTEFKVSYTTQDTGQNSLNGAEFPLFTVRSADGEANISLGPDTFRHGNELSQEFFQVKAKAEYLAGNHTLKAGFEYEDVNVNNLFAPNAEGQYFFESLADLEAGQASALIYENAITNDENDRRALWGYSVGSVYLQDVVDVTDFLTLQFGLRYDFYGSSGEIAENNLFSNRYGFTNTTDLDGLDVLMPRFSFNLDATDNLRVRGGLGRFSGGAPSVWISNSYSNSGVTADDVFVSNPTVPFSPDSATGNYIPADALATLAGQSPDGFVAALAPDFAIPTTIKANLGFAYDADIPFVGNDWTLTADVLYNKYENAPFWSDQSCVQNGVSPDLRPVFDCGGNGDPEAIVVRSVDEGESFLAAVSASKDWETDIGDIGFFASYTYADVDDIGQGTSSTATSNYSDTPRFSYQLARPGTSNYETQHNFKLRLKWEDELFGDYKTRVSLFGTRRSGQPYSYTFATTGRDDPFGIRENRADDAGALLYVPTGISDPNFSADSFGGDAAAQEAFFNYINSSELAEYRGQIAPRNAFRSRWQSIFDLSLEQQLPGLRDGHKTSFFLDVENLGNLLNSNWGVIERVRYEYEQQTANAVIQNGQYVYDRLDTTLSQEVLGNSLWKAQVGIKYEF
ncbi:TonB-dependent receptor domain-containing protein [Litorimonas sp. RW-G-Af-16]|uniref:TonB-dependent receptor n=1 Tax=Litorimonas sp. RW-G-Af-16 TaxID=3241168 RepID=UPI00390CCFD5